MKVYMYVFIAGIVFSGIIQANPLIRLVQTSLQRSAQTAKILQLAAKNGLNSFRSSLNAPEGQKISHAQGVRPVDPEIEPRIVNVDNNQNMAPIAQELIKAVSEKGSPITINIIDAKGNRGNIGSTFIKTTTSTKKTEQKFDGSFNQETNTSSKAKYHEGHLVGVSAATLTIVEIAHYMAG